MLNRIISSITIALLILSLAALDTDIWAFTNNAINQATGSDPMNLGRPALQLFSDREGLPQNSLQAITIDAAGYLWIGTQDGAACYNGRHWQQLNMPNQAVSNYVLTIANGKNGNLWFGTGGGGLHEYYQGKWQSFDHSNGLPDDVVETVLVTSDKENREVVWVGTHSGGLARLREGKFTIFNQQSGLPSDTILSLLETRGTDGNTQLWAGTENGLALFQHGQWRIFNETNGLPAKRVKALIETTAPDGSRAILAGTDGGGLARFTDNHWQIIDTSNGLSSNRVQTLMETKDGQGKPVLWVGTYNRGLALLRDNRWQVLDSDNGLPINAVASLAASQTADGYHTIWIGLDGGGLARWQLGKWLTIDTRQGLTSRVVMSWAETIADNGEQVIWMGLENSQVARLQNQQITIYDQDDGLPPHRLPSMVATKDIDGRANIWTGSWGGGLSRFDGQRWTNFTTKNSPLPNDNIFALLETRVQHQPALLIGTDGGGIARWQQGQWAIDPYPGLPTKRIFCFLETQDNQGQSMLWVGSWDGGLACWQDNRWRVFDTKTNLPANMITALLETREANGKHYLWVGTFTGGLARLDLDHLEQPPLILSDRSNPKLPNNTISRLVLDRQQRIYVNTNRGLARLTPRAPTSDNPAEYSIYTFTIDDGLPGNECTAGALVDSRGRIWAGTLRGATVYDPAQEVVDKIAKPLQIAPMINGHGVGLELKQWQQAGGTNFDYQHNNISFDYALLSYFRETDSQYRAQLVGYDDQPGDWNSEHKSTYTNLGRGDYTFKLWAKDYAGNISGPLELHFRIAPAPWFSWWAYCIYLLLLIAAGYGGIWLNFQRLQRRNRLLEGKIAERTSQLAEKNGELAETIEQLKISEQRAIQANQAKSIFLSNMSHELRTPLNAILGFTQILERDRRLDQEQRQSVTTISRSGEHLLGLINDILSISKIEAGKIVLTEDTFDLYHMISSVEDMIRIRTQSKSLQLIIDTMPGLPQYLRGDEGKLRQVLINLLSNAVKFTDQGGIVLRVKWQQERAFFEVEDTGQGIAPAEMNRLFEAFEQTASGQKSKEGTGLGLVISRNFVRLMDGDIHVRSEVGRGTIFSFDIKLVQATAEQQAMKAKNRVVGIAPDQRLLKLLIVDDKQENRILLARLLMQVGFHTREAANGKEALELWQSWTPDLIWMDMRMPVMDGLTATRKIREQERTWQQSNKQFQRVVIIGLTASVFEHDRDEIIKAGCDDFVIKPFREITIFEKISEYLGTRYLYEDSQSTAQNAKTTTVSASKFANLPGKLLTELNHVLKLGDIKAAQTVAKQIESVDERLAEELIDMIKSYRFDEILDVMEQLDFSHSSGEFR